MLNKNGERALCYPVIIEEILPIEGADNIALARVLGWHVIVKKTEFAVGDKAIYFEIDSKVPADDERFAFLEKKKYSIKTMKLNKFGVISQGLLMPLSEFPEVGDPALDEDLTQKLKVTYYEAEDNIRKANPKINPYARMTNRHPKFFKAKIGKWMMKHEWSRKLLFFFLGRKKDKRGWPEWVSKTDEPRCQNEPWRFPGNSDQKWIVTEKIDGTSTTATYRKGRKYGFYICSRNVVFDKPNKKCFYETNVYTEMAEKYRFEDVLKDLVSRYNLEWATIQGETFGAGVQKRDYSMPCHDFYAFNLIFSDRGRLNSCTARDILAQYNIPWVPILDTNYVLPDTVDDMLTYADGLSIVDGKMREGVVLRSKDGKDSFKAVSNQFLLKYHS